MTRLEKKIDFHGEDIAVIKSELITLKDDVSQIKKRLLGNGKTGICDTVTIHKTYFKILGACLVILGVASIGLILDKIFGS